MSSEVQFTLTEMLRESGRVLEAAEQGHDVLLKRRDGADMVLVEASREEGIRDGLKTAASLLLAVLSTGPASEALKDRAVDLMPWLAVLPDEYRVQFLREFARAAAAAVDSGEFTHLSAFSRDWRATAQLYANPATRSWLMNPPELDQKYIASQLHARPGHASG